MVNGTTPEPVYPPDGDEDEGPDYGLMSIEEAAFRCAMGELVRNMITPSQVARRAIAIEDEMRRDMEFTRPREPGDTAH
jgi:hypothetical protein